MRLLTVFSGGTNRKQVDPSVSTGGSQPEPTVNTRWRTRSNLPGQDITTSNLHLVTNQSHSNKSYESISTTHSTNSQIFCLNRCRSMSHSRSCQRRNSTIPETRTWRQTETFEHTDSSFWKWAQQIHHSTQWMTNHSLTAASLPSGKLQQDPHLETLGHRVRWIWTLSISICRA